ncbi:HAD family phosphatase [Streptomyces somaliensis]|uniref:HAD family hydrolase n=1 Tax=Streptomyces somaliensis TaxID=78355 RepID=UPI0020CFC577|nr:HAD family phosphatase [Streptomyces somaliensis]MCP9946653.1 HAD family phosphatase [Streptomyces somaliensis]MCP9960215.1 HAD family phosphatase [Streptomyces somaliensis]MCP9963396.1 HAD family phosphatase [Streptomyces somaliensis]MCP9963768.1 HAD family phosphatase [Streptomyces somaliensis]MCP9972976.1 HAD family phosphatase [Streptomyces somaliensis]
MSTGTAARAAASVDAVVFDYGGVLTTPVKHSIDAWLAADGIDPASFSRTLKAWLSRTAAEGTPIHRLETGELAIGDFEELLAAELVTVDSRPLPAAGILDRLFAGMRVDPAMPALVAELRELGIRVGLLSNSWGNTYPRAKLEALFDDIVISGEVGLRKPNADIYRLALERLGVTAERTVFVDDAVPNVDGARALGLGGVLHTGPAGTRAALAELVPGLAATAPVHP